MQLIRDQINYLLLNGAVLYNGAIFAGNVSNYFSTAYGISTVQNRILRMFNAQAQDIYSIIPIYIHYVMVIHRIFFCIFPIIHQYNKTYVASENS